MLRRRCFGSAADYPYGLRLRLCLSLRTRLLLDCAKPAGDVADGEEQILKYYNNFGLHSENYYGTPLPKEVDLVEEPASNFSDLQGRVRGAPMSERWRGS